MRKIVFVFVLFCSIAASAQKSKKKPLIEFQPEFRLGIQAPRFFGNNYFANDFKESIGVQTTLTLAKVKNFRFGLGFDVQKLHLQNPEIIGAFSHVNIKTTSILIEYEKKANNLFTISPTISIGVNDVNYRDEGIIASQYGNELKVGSYFSRNLDKTFAVFGGLHYAYYFNANLNASQENKDYFGHSNKVVLSIGIQVH